MSWRPGRFCDTVIDVYDEVRPGSAPAAGMRLVWTPCGPRVVGASPLRRPCPFCMAAVGQRCTRPSHRRGGRAVVPTHTQRLTGAEVDAA